MFNENVIAKIKDFIDAAKIEYPHLQGTITRRQVDEVYRKHNTKWPHAIVTAGNTVSRGVYNFPSDPIYITSSPKVEETDEELEIRIEETYSTLTKLIRGVSANAVNSLIVSGAPGLGKSYEVNKTLNDINYGEYGYVFHRGYIKATHLFRMLWENRQRGKTIVLDDTDSIFGDETALNILKAALELKDVRTIGWGSEKEFKDEDGDVIPRYFKYEGNIIFLTNLPFSDIASGTSKNAPHLAALESRSLVLDLKINTKRELMAKVKQTVRKGMLRNLGLTAYEEQQVLEFMEENTDRLKDISLRMAEKITAMVLMDRDDWKPVARTVCLR